jgi:hypothetical protein
MSSAVRLRKLRIGTFDRLICVAQGDPTAVWGPAAAHRVLVGVAGVVDQTSGLAHPHVGPLHVH